MDETKGATKDSQTETSGGKEGSTSTDRTTETVTRAEAKIELDKAVSDALSTAGRTAKAFESRTSLLDARDQKLKDAEVKDAERQKTKDVKELDDAKDDPQLLSAVKIRQEAHTQIAEAKKEREEARRERAEHETEIAEAKATKLDTAISGIAKKHGVDLASLKEIGITDLKQLDGVAKAISDKKPFVDSGKTLGGSDWRDLSPTDKVRAGLKGS